MPEIIKKNKNVLYIEMEKSIEDSILLSRVTAAKLKCLNINCEITVNSEQHPLNLYGDETEFKFLPDIGETVNANDIILER